MTPVSDTIICAGGFATLMATATGGNGSPYSYVWDNGNLSGNGPHQVSPTSPRCYTVYATDVNGCVSPPDSVCVSIAPPLFAVASTDQAICEGDQVILAAAGSGGTGGPYNYIWNNGAGTGASVTVTPTGYPNDVTYIVSVDDGCSPTATDTIVISFHETPVIDIVLDNAQGCSPLKVLFTNNSTGSYECIWSLGDGYERTDCDTFHHVYTMPGTYPISIIIKSNEGCVTTGNDITYVTVYPDPLPWFEYNPFTVDMMEPTYDFVNGSSNAVSYEWDFGDGHGSQVENPTHTYADTGSYTVLLEATSVHGCVDTTSLDVRVKPYFNVFIPNAFTPNSDGLNDFFFPKGTGIADDDYQLRIFDRWGELIFEGSHLSTFWDGRAKGGEDIAQNGVYIYDIRLKDALLKTHQYTGHVTLVR